MIKWLINKLFGKEDKLKEFERETGKNAMWGGKITKQFKEWKENNEY